MFALIREGEVVKYPYTLTDARRDNPDKCVPVVLTDENMAALGAVRVFSTPEPSFNPEVERVVELLPSFNGDRLEQRWAIVPLTGEELSHRQAQRLQELKAAREIEVANIKVTTQSGKTFDGDEKSQDRMSRAINSLNPGETTLWILADNTPDPNVSREELQEALRLAGAAHTAIWVRPYQ